MRVIPDGKRKPIAAPGGWLCPKCRAILGKRAVTCFGFDLVCRKGHFRAGVVIR